MGGRRIGPYRRRCYSAKRKWSSAQPRRAYPKISHPRWERILLISWRVYHPRRFSLFVHGGSRAGRSGRRSNLCSWLGITQGGRQPSSRQRTSLQAADSESILNRHLHHLLLSDTSGHRLREVNSNPFPVCAPTLPGQASFASLHVCVPLSLCLSTIFFL